MVSVKGDDEPVTSTTLRLAFEDIPLDNLHPFSSRVTSYSDTSYTPSDEDFDLFDISYSTLDSNNHTELESTSSHNG